jgi:hypothetical protein
LATVIAGTDRAYSSLPEWSRRLIAELEASDRRAERLVRGLSDTQLNWKPAQTAWSIGQCLEHLVVGSDLYLPAIAEALAGRRPSPVSAVTPGWFSRQFIERYVAESPAARRARAPKKIQPPSRVDRSVLERFLRNSEAARALIVRASAYDVNRIRFRNPFVPIIRFTVGTGLEILARHPGRHLLQAERVRESVGFPGP